MSGSIPYIHSQLMDLLISLRTPSTPRLFRLSLFFPDCYVFRTYCLGLLCSRTADTSSPAFGGFCCLPTCSTFASDSPLPPRRSAVGYFTEVRKQLGLSDVPPSSRRMRRRNGPKKGTRKGSSSRSFSVHVEENQRQLPGRPSHGAERLTRTVARGELEDKKGNGHEMGTKTRTRPEK